MATESFRESLQQKVFSSFSTLAIAIANKIGLFDILEKHGVGGATLEEISKEGNYKLPMVDQVLAGLVVSEIVILDPKTSLYHLPEGRLAEIRNLEAFGIFSALFFTNLPELVSAIDANGPPVPFHGREAYADVYDVYTRRKYTPEFVQGYVENVPGLQKKLENGIKVLDVGCYDGTVPIILAETYTKSTFEGFDINAEMIKKGEKEIEEKGLKNVKIWEGDATKIPESLNDSYDFVICNNVMHHLPDVATALKDISKVMKKGAYFSAMDIDFGGRPQENVGNIWANFRHMFNLNYKFGEPIHHHGAQHQHQKQGQVHRHNDNMVKAENIEGSGLELIGSFATKVQPLDDQVIYLKN